MYAKEPGSCSQEMCVDNNSSGASMFVLRWIVVFFFFLICFASNERTTKILESKSGHCSPADFFFQVICTFVDLSHFHYLP